MSMPLVALDRLSLDTPGYVQPGHLLLRLPGLTSEHDRWYRVESWSNADAAADHIARGLAGQRWYLYHADHAPSMVRTFWESVTQLTSHNRATV